MLEALRSLRRLHGIGQIRAYPKSAALPQPRQQVLRVCEISARLGVGVACAYRDSLANVIVGRNKADVSFACPAVRDDTGGAGGYSIYEAPVLGSDPGSGGPIRCTLR